MDSGLLFCKVIFTSDDEEQVEIPPNIVKHLDEVVSDEVVLKDRYKNTWPVKVSKSREKWCFKMGWHQFFEDNFIKVGDILVFSYKDQNSFNVTLFGEDSCEKVAANLCPAEEVAAAAAEEEEEEGQCVKKEAIEFEDDEKEVYQSNDLFDGSDENYQGKEEEENDYSDSSGEGYEEEEEEEEQVHKRKKNSNEKSKSSTSFDPIKKEDGEAAGDNINAKTKTRYKKQKQKIIDYYGKDIFALGLALRPANPYFVSRSRCPRRANELHIPKKLISHYGLNLPKSLQLVDEKGMEWETKIKRWKDGRVWCCGGWGALSRVNDIGFDDTCICEFVQDHRKGLSIFVRLVNTAN